MFTIRRNDKILIKSQIIITNIHIFTMDFSFSLELQAYCHSNQEKSDDGSHIGQMFWHMVRKLIYTSM
jgi:hypothetical protein